MRASFARRGRKAVLSYGEFWVGPTSVGPNPLPFKRMDGKARLKSDQPDSQFRARSERFHRVFQLHWRVSIPLPFCP